MQHAWRSGNKYCVGFLDMYSGWFPSARHLLMPDVQACGMSIFLYECTVSVVVV